MSDLLEVRVVGTFTVADQAATRLADVLEVDRVSGPRRSRKTPGLVLFYLTGRLRPAASAAAAARRAPLAEIEERKGARDLGGELAAVTGHWAEMEAQPWWPPQVGDVAIGHPDSVDPDPYGETFLAEDYPTPLGLRFRSVSRTRGEYAPEDGYGIEDLWFKWPAISVVRAGVIYPPRRGGERR